MSEPMYLHCRNCMDARPSDQSMDEWSRLDVALIDESTLEVSCRRCKLPVTQFDLAVPRYVDCELCGKGIEHHH